MKKIFITVLTIVTIFCMASCSDTTNQIVTSDTSIDNGTMTKHVVNLTLENFTKYINLNTKTYYGSGIAGGFTSNTTFSGALSYAYYDNVTIKCVETDSYGNKGEECNLILNAGGFGGPINTASSSTYYQIVDITGRVIYWI